MIFTFYINQFLFFFLIFCLLVQLIYFWGIFSRFAFKKEKPVKIDDKESSNYLPMFIKAFQNFQDYDKENYEQENKNNDKNYSKQMIRYIPKKSSSSLLPKNDHFPIKKTIE